MPERRYAQEPGLSCACGSAKKANVFFGRKRSHRGASRTALPQEHGHVHIHRGMNRCRARRGAGRAATHHEAEPKSLRELMQFLPLSWAPRAGEHRKVSRSALSMTRMNIIRRDIAPRRRGEGFQSEIALPPGDSQHESRTKDSECDAASRSCDKGSQSHAGSMRGQEKTRK